MTEKNWEYKPILEWSQLSKTFPWGVFMLQGAGLAIAEGFRVNPTKQKEVYFSKILFSNPSQLICHPPSLVSFDSSSEHPISLLS